jgi:hypothetical protein
VLFNACERIAAELATVVPVRSSAVHRGIFDARELARASVQAPALLVHVASLRPAPSEDGGDAYGYTAALTCYVVQRDHAAGDRLERALDDLIAPLLGYIPGRLWCDADGASEWTAPAGSVEASSLYSATIDQQAIALWALAWDQSIRLPRVRPAI